MISQNPTPITVHIAIFQPTTSNQPIKMNSTPEYPASHIRRAQYQDIIVAGESLLLSLEETITRPTPI